MNIFKLPDLGEGLHEAEIRKWYVAEGDTVELDQPIVCMETAKAVVDVPAPFSGRVAKLYGKEGDIIATGAPLIAFEGEGGATAAGKKDAGTVVGAIISGETVINESPTGVDVKATSKSGAKATPAVRALANKLHVDLSQVKATGPNGSITLDDVQKAAHGSPASTTVAEGGETLHSTRRAMAINMAKAHAEVAPVTLADDADIHQWPAKTDVTLRIIRAIVKACEAEPELNAHFNSAALSLKLFKEINLGIAVDTTSGLFVPVIKNVGNLSTEEIRSKINEFKEKARTVSFSPQDLQQATITLSNFGAIAGRYANPMIMPPMVAIVGVGKSRPEVVAVNNAPAVHNIMPVAVTIDHRVVTGGECARFLAALIEDLQKPN
jgi:2-oxoisovalerate dehydrogenase E2 component (dihydrolipoyl transacylase)